MNDFVFLFIRNGIIMSLFTLIYSMVTKIQFKAFEVKWRYYSWMVIVIGLIVPFKPRVSVSLQAGSFFSRIFKVRQGVPTSTSLVSESPDKLPTSCLTSIFIIIWGLGIILFWIYLIYRHKQFLTFIKRWSEEINDSMIKKVLYDMQQRLGISKSPRLVKCSYVNSPMMLGFMKPLVILPDKSYDMDEITFILHHELLHFKRKDLWYKGLTFLAISIYWFNPIVYFMAQEIAILCEISCDEEVLKEANYTQRQKYSKYLIDVIKSQLGIQSVFATNFCGGKYNTKRRILSVLSMKKRKKEYFSSILLVGGIVATGITFSIKTEALELNQNYVVYQNETIADASENIEKDKTSDLTQYGLSLEEVLQNKNIQVEKITSDFVLVKENSSQYMLIEQSDDYVENE